jgi:hypothetical protein
VLAAGITLLAMSQMRLRAELVCRRRIHAQLAGPVSEV